jgi:hypothetical protein
MNSRIIEIQADMEMTKELLKVERETILGKIQTVLYECIIVPCCANLIKTNFSIGLCGKPEIDFEIGFWNPDENRIDFGSDAYFSIGDNKEHLQINYGTIGSYDITDFCQVKRVRMINHIFDHINEIEDRLNEILNEYCGKYIELDDHRNDLYYEERRLEKETIDVKKAEIESSLTKGVRVSYKDEVFYRDRIFEVDHHCNNKTWEIIKETPKFVTLANVENYTHKCKKEVLVNEIYKGNIVII